MRYIATFEVLCLSNTFSAASSLEMNRRYSRYSSRNGHGGEFPAQGLPSSSAYVAIKPTPQPGLWCVGILNHYLNSHIGTGRGAETLHARTINRYQYVRLLPARVVSVISISYVNHLLIMLLRPRAYARGCSKLKLFVLSFSFSLLKIKIILRVRS